MSLFLSRCLILQEGEEEGEGEGERERERRGGGARRTFFYSFSRNIGTVENEP